ncbi:copper-containing nitrite reductase [Pelagibacterium halotolerans]|uniref:copper-containing nitrite reductase n=1 Tax=Pelagibacterium halotolerans TaxID=531813 RepID=UPI00384EB56F
MTRTTAMLRRTFLAGIASAAIAAPFGLALPAFGQDATTDIAALEHVQVDLVAPPFVHGYDQVAPTEPRVVQFRMEIEERPHVIDRQGTTLQAMTFDGSIPGPLMVVHEGDYVELTLVNPGTNSLMHDIDFHAATGALGGGALTHVNPGEEVVLRWKATRPGVFVYHCAPPGMIAWHVVTGMSGAIMVLPRDGLKDENGDPIVFDRTYYIGENDFYIPRDENGDFKSYGSLGESYADTMDTITTLTPSHVVFNGAVGALTGENALTANVGETVLFVHSSANRDTRPHLIGGHGDYVWAEGSFNNPPLRDLETWHIPGGAAGAAVYTFLQPGVYAYVNHNLIEAEQLGATAHVIVEGEWNDDLMTQVVEPRPIQ